MRSLGYSIAASWVEEPEKELALRKGLGKNPWNQLSPAQAGVSWAGLLWGGGWTQMLREDWKKEVVRRAIGSASALFWQQGATCTSGRSQTITTESSRTSRPHLSFPNALMLSVFAIASGKELQGATTCSVRRQQKQGFLVSLPLLSPHARSYLLNLEELSCAELLLKARKISFPPSVVMQQWCCCNSR